MSTTLEASSESAEAEAAAALADADAARRASEAAATGMTQAEREAAAEHDAGVPDKPRTPAQGNLSGGWEELIGGQPDSQIKVNLKKPAAVDFENQPENLRKQTVHRILLTVKVTGFGSDDTLDPDTHDVAESKGKRTLRVLGGVFLDPDEYIERAEGHDVAADAAADAEAHR